MSLTTSKRNLLRWYGENKRELPWRTSRDPYRIWISETMLQQTTTTAVIPFFQRFIERFPSLKILASAKVGEVVEAWAGLGYYSRARNLHKSAVALNTAGGFPKTFEELITFPGFGPYTSRAVSSLAFDQEVGVVDGNVIRVLSRFQAADWDWWQNKVRDLIQTQVDAWVKDVSPYEMNQALMELGRTICTPKSPSCLLCPLRQDCRAYAQDQVARFPKPRPRRARELWLWRPVVCVKNGRILLQKNSSAPFLKGQWLLPATSERVEAKPKTYQYKHSITHHDIYVTLSEELPKIEDKLKSVPTKDTKWVLLKELRQHVPVALVQKALAEHESSDSGDVHLKDKTRRRS